MPSNHVNGKEKAGTDKKPILTDHKNPKVDITKSDIFTQNSNGSTVKIDWTKQINLTTDSTKQNDTVALDLPNDTTSDNLTRNLSFTIDSKQNDSVSDNAKQIINETGIDIPIQKAINVANEMIWNNQTNVTVDIDLKQNDTIPLDIANQTFSFSTIFNKTKSTNLTIYINSQNDTIQTDKLTQSRNVEIDPIILTNLTFNDTNLNYDNDITTMTTQKDETHSTQHIKNDVVTSGICHY